MTETIIAYGYALDLNQANAPARERPIEIALQELGKATDENAELVQRLAERLQPLLTTAHPAAVEGAAPQNEGAAPLRMRLAGRVALVTDTNAVLSSLLQRLEV